MNKNQEKNIQYIFEQYKLYVEMADRVCQRRASTNTFFLSINTAILTVVGTVGFDIKKYSLVISLVGIILSYTWFYILHSYKLLNSGKFEVIHQIEEKLPLNLYGYEWNILGEGKIRSKYWPISHLEKIVPVLFGVVFVIFEVISIIGGW
ncbi:RipA family octameric membrane protein [Anaerobium acetethylicum]|uniref:Small integral membrane protein n=1 Tax=Anaerobium acetethylicum TaxID=1619234 RepID=A0A1D3TUX9_9FIRM|nr:hypothetical protein [Anaerobium acetethylicum]SCP97911.1 hypothetical protein SAMN05421730_101497 [Anaerobium acetethylicum]